MLITSKLLTSDEMDESGVFDDSLHYFQNGLNVANEIIVQSNSYGNNIIQNKTNERAAIFKETFQREKQCADDPCLNDEHSAIENLKHQLRLGNFEHMFCILQSIKSSSENRDEFLRLWDESHYQYYKQNRNPSGKLSSIQKYRIRLRNPPPPGICPDGVRPRNRLSSSSLKVLRDWYKIHATRPYPCRITKEALSKRTGIPLNKVSFWFSNARRKHRSHGLEAVVGKTYCTQNTQTTSTTTCESPNIADNSNQAEVSSWFSNARRKHRSHGLETVVGKTYCIQNTQTTSTATCESPNIAPTSTMFSSSQTSERQSATELYRPLPEADNINQVEVSNIEATAKIHEKYLSNDMFCTQNDLQDNVSYEQEEIIESDSTSIALLVGGQNTETTPEVNDYYYVLRDLADRSYFHVVDLRSICPVVEVVQEVHDYCLPTEKSTSDYSTQRNVDSLSENSESRNTQCHASSASIENDVFHSTFNDSRTGPRIPFSTLPATDNINKCIDISIDLTNKQLTDALKSLYNLRENISNNNEALDSKQCETAIPNITSDVKPRAQDYNHNTGPGYDTDVLLRKDAISQSSKTSSKFIQTPTCHTSNVLEMTTANSYENEVGAYYQMGETNKKLETIDRPFGKMQGVHSKTKVNNTVSALKLRLKLQGHGEDSRILVRGPNKTEPDTESINVNKCLDSLQKLCEKVTNTVQSPEDYALSVHFNEYGSDSEQEHDADHMEDEPAEVLPVWDKRSWKKRALKPANRKEENRVCKNNGDGRLSCRCGGNKVPLDVENTRERASRKTQGIFGLDLINASQSQRHKECSRGLCGSYYRSPGMDQGFRRPSTDALGSPMFTIKHEMEPDFMTSQAYSYSRMLLMQKDIAYLSSPVSFMDGSDDDSDEDLPAFMHTGDDIHPVVFSGHSSATKVDAGRNKASSASSSSDLSIERWSPEKSFAYKPGSKNKFTLDGLLADHEEKALDWEFDTVVGEAVQGLLNLSSSQESSSSSLQ